MSELLQKILVLVCLALSEYNILILDSHPGQTLTIAGVATFSFAVGVSGFRKQGPVLNIRTGRIHSWKEGA